MSVLGTAVMTFVLLLSLVSCTESFKSKNEIAFVVEERCVIEVEEYFEMLHETSSFRARLIPTPARDSMFESIKHVGVIQTSENLDLTSYALGAKQDCGSRSTGIYTYDGPVSIDPYVYRTSHEEGKVIFVEVDGDNAKVYQ